MTFQAKSRILAAAAAASAALFTAGVGLADTIALYKFDTMADANDGGAGERAFDSSGNNLDITRGFLAGYFRLTQDIPSVAPAGSLAGYSASPLNDAPSSQQFSLAYTGQLSAEFWYKPQIATTIHSVLTFPGSGASKNSWGVYQYYPSGGKTGIKAWFYDNASPPTVSAELNSGPLWDTDGFNPINPEWHHIAVTFDASKTARMYVDGVQKDSRSYAAANYQVASAPLRLGSDQSGNFGGQFNIDDLRISNVALPAGSGTGVNELAWNTSLSQAANPGPRPVDLGKQWVRRHSYTISSWGGTSDVAAYAAAGFNTAVNNRSAYHTLANAGFDNQMLGAFTGFDDSVITELHIASNAARLTSYLIRDEIPEAEIPDIAQQAAYIRSIDSSRIIIAGLGSSGPSYIDNVVTNIQPDALIHGYYPWQGASSATDDLSGMLSDWVSVRQKGLQYSLPVFSYIQTFDDQTSSPNPPDDRRRLPSESELRTEVYAKLSAGVKGLVDFVFDARAAGGVDQALINPDGSQSSLYAPAATLNAEVLRLGKSLRHIDSTDWRFVSGGITPVPGLMQPWSAGAGSDPKIQSIAVDGTPTAGKDGLIGFFADDSGQQYFMLSNLNHAQGGSAAATAASFTIVFDSSINELLRLNRSTGEPEKLTLSGHTLNLTLPGGTGDLLKYNTGFFAGIPGGDTNLDGQVDVIDLGVLATHWQGVGSWKDADFNFDGKIDVIDLGILATNWQVGVSGPALSDALAAYGLPNVSVPEPASVGLLGLGSLLALRRVRQLPPLAKTRGERCCGARARPA